MILAMFVKVWPSYSYQNESYQKGPLRTLKVVWSTLLADCLCFHSTNQIKRQVLHVISSPAKWLHSQSSLSLDKCFLLETHTQSGQPSQYIIQSPVTSHQWPAATRAMQIKNVATFKWLKWVVIDIFGSVGQVGGTAWVWLGLKWAVKQEVVSNTQALTWG